MVLLHYCESERVDNVFKAGPYNAVTGIRNKSEPNLKCPIPVASLYLTGEW